MWRAGSRAVIAFWRGGWSSCGFSVSLLVVVGFGVSEAIVAEV